MRGTLEVGLKAYLHPRHEAQKAETVLSAVSYLSIYLYISIYISISILYIYIYLYTHIYIFLQQYSVDFISRVALGTQYTDNDNFALQSSIDKLKHQFTFNDTALHTFNT